MYLFEHGPLANMAIVPEPHGANNRVTTHAGVIVLAVHTIGKSRYTSSTGNDTAHLWNAGAPCLFRSRRPAGVLRIARYIRLD